jgi:hypothetical protein
VRCTDQVALSSSGAQSPPPESSLLSTQRVVSIVLFSIGLVLLSGVVLGSPCDFPVCC